MAGTQPPNFATHFQVPALPASFARRVRVEEWNLLAPQLKQKEKLPIGYASGQERGITSFLKSGRSFNAFHKLARPKFEEDDDDLLLQIELGKLRSKLETLPPELLDLILDFLPVPSKIQLGLSSKQLWNTTILHAQSQLRTTLGSWARTPLICAAKDIQDLPDSISALLPNTTNNEETPLPPAQTRIHNALDSYQELQITDWQTALPQQNLPSSLQSALQIPHTQAASYWLLRNHTTHSLIRLQFAKSPPPSPGPEITHLTQTARSSYFVHVEDEPLLSLDRALIMRIAWSGVDRPLMKGIWAGHSFDVVPSSQHEHEEKWRDVTDEIIQEAKEQNLLRTPRIVHAELTVRERVMIESMGRGRRRPS